MIRELRPDDIPACEAILRRLPQWFGIEESLVQYVKHLSKYESYAAERSGRIAGFISVHTHNPASAEIHVIAVDHDAHGRGIGRAMVEHVEKLLRERRVEFLQVKTLGPSRPDPNYERTRGFYERMGFRALEETQLWGPRNPCLIMVKHLGSA